MFMRAFVLYIQLDWIFAYKLKRCKKTMMLEGFYIHFNELVVVFSILHLMSVFFSLGYRKLDNKENHNVLACISCHIYGIMSKNTTMKWYINNHLFLFFFNALSNFYFFLMWVSHLLEYAARVKFKLLWYQCSVVVSRFNYDKVVLALWRYENDTNALDDHYQTRRTRVFVLLTENSEFFFLRSFV